MSDRLDEIKARLAAATPAPWQRFDTTDSGLLPDVVDRDFNHIASAWGHNEMRSLEARHNGDLIAHAPADLAWLVAEVERLRAEGAA